MNKTMAAIDQKPKKELEDIKNNFEKSTKLTKEVFENEAFRKITKSHPINKALFDAIFTHFARLSDKEMTRLKNNKDQFKKELKHVLKNDTEFFNSVTSGTGNQKKVLKRHETVRNLIHRTIYNINMISSIEIKNFKIIKSKVFPLRNLNVLFGLNGHGKSSFIQRFIVITPK